MLRLSPFRIQMFNQCKLQYKFFYLDDLKKHYDKPKPVIVMGEHVHRALDSFYTLKPEDRTEKELHDLLRKSWIRNRSCFGKDEKDWGEKAISMLSLYLKQHGTEKEPHVREQYLDITIRPDLVLLGKVDRIDLLEDNTLHIIDYKTGKEREQSHAGTLQLLLYAVLASRKYNLPVSKASFWYLATTKDQSIVPTEDDLEAALLEVEEIAAEINVEEEYEPSPSALCKFCDFQEICPAFLAMKRE